MLERFYVLKLLTSTARMSIVMESANSQQIFTHNIIACVWDFDRTLAPGYMQHPIFEHYGVDEERFWQETNQLGEIYAKRGVSISEDTIYLNHLLSYVRDGPLRGLNNQKLRELGAKLTFFPGLPDFFMELKELVSSKESYRSHDITLEHYIISGGLKEMIAGSSIAEHVEMIYGCEFIEDPCPPGFDRQHELSIETPNEIAQIAAVVDNTVKTRFIFNINKGVSKNNDIDVNAFMQEQDRRIPIRNMLYIADGPSDVPVFSVLKQGGGKTYAVYEEGNEKEFAQNDTLLRTGRIQAYGPANYTPSCSTHMWLKMHVQNICEDIIKNTERALDERTTMPPRHLHDDEILPDFPVPRQADLFEAKNK